MNVLLLAAGLGSRLRPLTNKTPKCLMTVGGVPLLSIWLDKLNKINLKKIVINTHYLASSVDSFLAESQYKEKIIISYESELLGTAGTLISNLHHFANDDLMVIHADNYCLADLNEFIKTHRQRPKSCLMTMMTFKPNDPTSCGIVKTENGVVIDFFEKSTVPVEGMANAAIYILSKEMLDLIGKQYRNITDISTELIVKFLGNIYTYHTTAPNVDIGTIDSYAEANKIEVHLRSKQLNCCNH